MDELRALFAGLSEQEIAELIEQLPVEAARTALVQFQLDDMRAPVFKMIDELEDMAIATGELDGPDPTWDRTRNRRRR